MDILGRVDQILAGGLSSDSMFMSWPELNNNGLGLLIMNISIDYRQPIRRIFELGPGVVPVEGNGFENAGYCDGLNVNAACADRTQPTWYIIGRPEGRLQLSRIIGPQALSCDFYRVYGSACSSNLMRINGRAGCKATDASAKQMTWLMTGVVLDGLSMGATAQESIMQENPTAMFAGLKMFIDNQDCATTTNELIAVF